MPGVARPLCAVSHNAHTRPAPRTGGTALRLHQNGEQPDRITVSIPAQPTLSEENFESIKALLIRTVQPAAPRPVHIPSGAVFHPRETLDRRTGQSFPTTALYGAARDARSFSSHLQILYQIAMPQKEQAGGRAFRRPQGFLLLYPKRAGFVKTCFSKACQRRALRTL